MKSCNSIPSNDRGYSFLCHRSRPVMGPTRRLFPQRMNRPERTSMPDHHLARLYSVSLMHSDYFYIVHDNFLLSLQDFCQWRLQESILPILHALIIRPSINLVQKMPTSYPYGPTRLIVNTLGWRTASSGFPRRCFPVHRATRHLLLK
jgi:hypothetical protein